MEACERYNVKSPHLNANLFEDLLSRTDINKELQKSLVRGWREGFDLGSELPEEDHIVRSPIVDDEHLGVLKASIEQELKLRRLCGPFDQPIRDDRWFSDR